MREDRLQPAVPLGEPISPITPRIRAWQVALEEAIAQVDEAKAAREAAEARASAAEAIAAAGTADTFDSVRHSHRGGVTRSHPSMEERHECPLLTHSNGSLTPPCAEQVSLNIEGLADSAARPGPPSTEQSGAPLRSTNSAAELKRRGLSASRAARSRHSIIEQLAAKHNASLRDSVADEVADATVAASAGEATAAVVGETLAEAAAAEAPVETADEASAEASVGETLAEAPVAAATTPRVERAADVEMAVQLVTAQSSEYI